MRTDGRAEAERFASAIGADGCVIGNPACSVLMVDAQFAAFEGRIEPSPFFRIGMATARASRLYQDIGDTRIDGLWRPGTLVVTPPGAHGQSANDAVRMMGLAVDSERWPCPKAFESDRLIQAASQFHHDALLTSVLTALWREADVHGASTAFFEHGVALILQRLLELPPPAQSRTAHPLSPARLARVTEWIECRLGADLSVTEMAAVAGLEVSGFARAFRAATGTTPYGYLTARRMERAKRLLATGESVAQTAAAMGYANPAKFAAAFRRVVGLPPSLWQKTDERHDRSRLKDR